MGFYIEKPTQPKAVSHVLAPNALQLELFWSTKVHKTYKTLAGKAPEKMLLRRVGREGGGVWTRGGLAEGPSSLQNFHSDVLLVTAQQSLAPPPPHHPPGIQSPGPEGPK